MKKSEFCQREIKLDTFFRKNRWLLWSITLLVALSLYAGIYFSMLLYDKGFYWAIAFSGLFAHAFFVITMHDGAHQAITKTKFDRWIMNTASGMIALPVYTELFRKFHLLHHAHTNTYLDPLWGSNKRKMFEKHRLIYAFLQMLPFVLNLYMLATRTKKEKQDHPFIPKVSYLHISWSVFIALLVIWYVRPAPGFVFGTFAFMTSIGAIRYWGEHMGITTGKESNTHWFPLGMGIGNHEVHHSDPGISWLSLTIGMWFRKKDTNPVKTVYRLIFHPEFNHYTSYSAHKPVTNKSRFSNEEASITSTLDKESNNSM